MGKLVISDKLRMDIFKYDGAICLFIDFIVVCDNDGFCLTCDLEGSISVTKVRESACLIKEGKIESLYTV